MQVLYNGRKRECEEGRRKRKTGEEVIFEGRGKAMR
jgi:hypothetical protein